MRESQMTTISPQKMEANRRNAQKSTGPRSAAGKSRARFNALKHGATAQIPVLPGEDPALFHGRLDAYHADHQPRSAQECELIERMALLSCQLDRAAQADVGRLAISVQTGLAAAAHREEQEAAALGQRLFFDRCGPLADYPSNDYLPQPGDPRTSWSGIADDPDDPARLVADLEFTGAGCRWLLARWAELRARIETGKCWQSPEKLMGIRLLGRQPLQAADVSEVTQIFLACHVLNPQYNHPFRELASELTEPEFKKYEDRLRGRDLKSMRPADAPAARAMLLGLVDRATGRLSTLADEHRLRDERLAEWRRHELVFDASIEGERLRRHSTACHRLLNSTITTFLKVRKAGETPEFDTLEPVDSAHSQAVAGAGRFLQNEPTLDDGDPQEEAGSGNGHDDTPEEWMEVMQMLAHRRGVLEQYRRNGNEPDQNTERTKAGFPGNDRKHRRNRKERNKRLRQAFQLDTTPGARF